MGFKTFLCVGGIVGENDDQMNTVPSLNGFGRPVAAGVGKQLGLCREGGEEVGRHGISPVFFVTDGAGGEKGGDGFAGQDETIGSEAVEIDRRGGIAGDGCHPKIAVAFVRERDITPVDHFLGEPPTIGFTADGVVRRDPFGLGEGEPEIEIAFPILVFMRTFESDFGKFVVCQQARQPAWDEVFDCWGKGIPFAQGNGATDDAGIADLLLK